MRKRTSIKTEDGETLGEIGQAEPTRLAAEVLKLARVVVAHSAEGTIMELLSGMLLPDLRRRVAAIYEEEAKKLHEKIGRQSPPH